MARERSGIGEGGGSGAAFERDFGYLMPFLDRVAQAAQQLQDPAARAELQRLMAEEKGRWARARALLAGASGTGAPAQRPAAPAVRAGAPPRAEAAPAPAGLTVGSLRTSRQP